MRPWTTPWRCCAAAADGAGHGAHPDDVEIGVGGTLAAHRSSGDQVVILTVSRGARGGAIAVVVALWIVRGMVLG